ncbi:adenine deaminase [Paenibacillus agilis]|uniref:Adenine deaminase n=1 Tax=Paenibacillus agilis TaxID=3020863 RepID=A0A559IQP6_9BACL|nr:adenine deaminase [Paenibacillus agilis]
MARSSFYSCQTLSVRFDTLEFFSFGGELQVTTGHTEKETAMKQWIAAASKREQADIVIRNGRIVDVFQHEIREGDIAITNGRIVGIGEYEGKQIIDAEGRYICPGFIDAHVHIESSMVTPSEFARVVLPHGVTSVITDPHEIANVSGTAGIQYMLDASEGLPLDVYVMLPSCVPSTPYEHAGAVLQAVALEPFYHHPRVLGLAEVMDYPSVHSGAPDMVRKLTDAYARGKLIDGHGAGLNGEQIDVYRAAGIRTDHECVSAEQARERLSRGMYVLLREGSVAKDVRNLASVVTPHNARRCLFCTDDKHLDELVQEGSINWNIKLAIESGIPALTAIQMATLNAAECYGLDTKGAVAPGYDADLLFLDQLDTVEISHVFKAGKLVASDRAYIGPKLTITAPPSTVLNSVRLNHIQAEQLSIPLPEHSSCSIIGIQPNSLLTDHLVEEVTIINGCFQPSIQADQLKMAVLERHQHTGHIGLGIVKGFGFSAGAIASTVAHDSHNLVVAGTNDADMLVAIDELRQVDGGLTVVKNGVVLATLPLPIAGLMATQPYEEVLNQLEQLHHALDQIGASTDFHPFVTLSFLCLPVIPELKLTDMGLFSFQSFSHISIWQSRS